MIEIATDNADAVRRIRDRLVDDVGFLLGASRSAQKTPNWALARSMWPIAESLGFLLYGGPLEGQTSPRLSRFIREELGSRNPEYAKIASVICQVWRHGLTHSDEPPFLVIDAPIGATGRDWINARAMSWKLVLWAPRHHLAITSFGTQSAQFTFCLDQFYEDLLAVVNDQPRWAGFQPDAVKNRYNEWCAKFIDNPSAGSEKALAAQEIRTVLP